MGLWQRIKNLFQPRGADKVLRILECLAMIDDDLDERELQFIQAFAKRWGFKIADSLQADGRPHPVEVPSFTSLREAMSEYLATRPRADQAQQLRDVLTALVTIDGRICEHEELMLGELGQMIDEFVGRDERSGYTVFITPQNAAQETGLFDSQPGVTKERRHDGEVFRVGTYSSSAYARLVCSWYRDAGYAPVVEREA